MRPCCADAKALLSQVCGCQCASNNHRLNHLLFYLGKAEWVGSTPESYVQDANFMTPKKVFQCKSFFLYISSGLV